MLGEKAETREMKEVALKIAVMIPGDTREIQERIFADIRSFY